MAGAQVQAVRGWPVHVLAGDALTVQVVPGKGADILAVRTAGGVDLLWASPWGLPERGSASVGTDPDVAFLEAYPGGWQTIFPNGGHTCTEQGVTWGFHGEAALVGWDVDSADASRVQVSTRLRRSPFHLLKQVSVDGSVVTVTETATNEGSAPVEVMWSHHPAFGAPLLGLGCTLSTSARTFVADDGPLGGGDLEPGATSAWPHAAGLDGRSVDLRVLPGPEQAVARLGYLTGFDGRAWMRLDNPGLGLSAEVGWDAAVLPHAWYWLEAHATAQYPWFGRAYVLGLEPASSHPGQGLAVVRRTTGTQVSFAPGESRTIEITLTVGSTPTPAA